MDRIRKLRGSTGLYEYICLVSHYFDLIGLMNPRMDLQLGLTTLENSVVQESYLKIKSMSVSAL